MAQTVQERPPDPVVHPSCEHCAKGDVPERREYGKPFLHELTSSPGPGYSYKHVPCPLRNHPLVVKDFGRVRDWAEWRNMWDEAKTYEQLLGLLHVGLDVSRRNGAWEEPILFYLAIAEEWKDGYSSYASEQTALNELKAKAWKMLVMHYWKLDKDERHRMDYAWSEFLKVPLVDATLDFFLRPHNLPRSDSDISENRVAYAFVEWFVEKLWQQATTDELRHLMIDQLRREKVMRLHINMGRHNQLLKPNGGLTRTDRRFLKRWALSGTESVTTLWRIASGLERSSEHRDVAIAHLLINDFIRRRELARIERVKRVERKKEQEEDRQKAIAQAVATAAAATQRLRELTGNSEK